MRVALVIGKYDAIGGGAERWTDRHARYLLARGFDVSLVARSFRGAPEGSHCIEIPKRPGLWARLGWGEEVEKRIRSRQFDIVHDMGDGWSGDLFMPHHGSRQAGQAQNALLLPPGLRPIQGMLHHALPRYREFAELERRQYSLDLPTRFVAISRRVAKDMRQLHGVPESRIDLVYNGIDTDRFSPGDGSPLRRAWGWDDRVIFVLVAHNFRLKGLHETIAALATLPISRQKIGLVVAGGGRPAPFARQIRQLGLDDSVRFLGNVPDSVAVYRAGDVYIQPTYYDPCSLVVLEAMACGLPSITTTINGASELMTPAMGEVIDHPTNLAALRQAMTRFLDDRERATAGEAARAGMARQTLSANSDQLIELYSTRGAQAAA